MTGSKKLSGNGMGRDLSLAAEVGVDLMPGKSDAVLSATLLSRSLHVAFRG